MKSFVLVLTHLLTVSLSSGAEWSDAGTYRSMPLPALTAHKDGFTLLGSREMGITFTNLIREQRHLTNQILLNGSGVAAGDVDGDGWCDLYFCSLDGPNKLFRNLGGWRFEDITSAARVGCADLDATGAAFADLDGDGDLDLIVNSVGGGTQVFANNGKGRFEKRAQLNGRKGGMSTAIGDLDGDGYLDLYVANYRTSALMDIPNARAVFKSIDGANQIELFNGRPMTDPDLTNRFVIGRFGSVEELGEVDGVYQNQGGTNFAAISFTEGTFLDEEGKVLSKPPFDWGLSVMIRDFSGDGWPDIYVCNDFESPDRFWINQRNGRFRAAPRLALRRNSYFSMGMDVADINRDGQDDIYVVDMLNRSHQLRLTQMLPLALAPSDLQSLENRPQNMVSTLFLNRGDGTYAEIALLSGLDATDWSWMPAFLDVDLDGWEDLLLVTGHERAARDLDVAEQIKLLRRSRRSLSDAEIFQARRAYGRMATGNLAFRNRGDLTFEEVGESWGFDYRGVSQGMALADLDNDGDLDVIINTSNDAPRLYQNNGSRPRVAVRLKGQAPNVFGVGARITVRGGAVPVQSQEMMAGGRYLSSDQPLRVFAAGADTNRLTIEVKWRNGRESVLRDVRAHQLYELNEADSRPVEPRGANPKNADASPLFVDASEQLNHLHADPFFDDFTRQPLLPHRLSQLGPGVSWWDVNRDGWEDLVIGSGKNGKLTVLTNNTRGGFARLDEAPLSTVVTRDQTTVLGWAKSKEERVLLAGSANYEDGLAVGPPVRQFNLTQRTIDESLPASTSSVGPLAMADLDGDGDLDLFAGGRVIAGKYPNAASSALYRNDHGKFTMDRENAPSFSDVGLVSGAVFSDLDADGDPDLALACEWGPLRIFRNEKGRLVDATLGLEMDRYTGWWNGITAGDFDGDGSMDLVASNWGRNTKYQQFRSQPLQMLYADFDGDGTHDVIEAHFDPVLRKTVPERQLAPMAQAMPFLRARVTSHRAYSEASVEELLGEYRTRAKVWQANWLESTVFLNRGGRFEARVLPIEAQFAPAFGVCVADANGDGNEDIFLAQNFFAVQPETPRYDGGRGLWLKGDGKGGFSAMPGHQSGVKIYGEQRGSAVCDYDRDGRVDLAVGQNGAATKLYRNVGARPGLRVTVRGEDGNPDGIGASIRLAFGENLGSKREIHAGSGYWSQDSACQVLGLPEKPTAILIQWPGGRQTRTELANSETREVTIDSSGKVLVTR